MNRKLPRRVTPELVKIDGWKCPACDTITRSKKGRPARCSNRKDCWRVFEYEKEPK